MNPEPPLSTRVLRILWTQAPRLVTSLVIAGGFVWLFRRGGLPLFPPRSAFANLTPWAVPSYVLITALGTWWRVHRWVYLLRPIAPEVSPRRVVGIGFVGIAAILFAPLRLGEAARPYLLARDGKVSFFQALGAAGAERVVDGFTLLLVSASAMLVATPLSPLPNRLGDMPVPVAAVPHALYIALFVFSAAFAALIAFYAAHDLAHRFTHRILGAFSPRLAKFVTDTLERLADGLKVLSSPRDRLRFFGETLGYWGAAFLGCWVLMRGSGMAGTLPEACVTLGILALGAVIPAGPGSFGTYQIAIYTGLALFFEQKTVLGAGAAMVFVSYATQLTLTALACVLGFWILGRDTDQAKLDSERPPAQRDPASATRNSNTF